MPIDKPADPGTTLDDLVWLGRTIGRAVRFVHLRARLGERLPRPGATAVRALALSAAVSSGCATLVYELAWLRWLTRAIGATFPAITVVLTSFMLGLGIGSLLGGRLADRSRAHLLAYAGLEVVVAVVAAAFPLLAWGVGNLDVGAAGPFSGRALVAGLALLPATTLMGMTFPLLSAALHRGDEGARHVPSLYGANTVGAALGAVIGGLILPFTIGVVGTLVAAGAFNLLAAALAGFASGGPVARGDTPVQPPPAEVPPRTSLLLVLSAGSGVLILLAELFWSRALLQLDRQQYASLLIEPSDAMTLVLVLVLLGNGLGSLVATRLAHATPAEIARVVAATWAVAGVFCLGGLEWPGVVALGLGDATPGPLVAYAVYLRLLAVFPPAVLFGLGFPLVMRLYSGALHGHGNRLSTIWLANTLGSVVGSVCGGWWLLPALGADRGLVGCAFLSVVLAGVALAFAGLRSKDTLAIAGTTGVIAAVAMFVPLGPGQVFRVKFGANAVVASWEGWEATTIVWQQEQDIEDDTRLLTSNGRTIRARQSLINGGKDAANISLDAEQVLLVGFGTGLFAKGLLSLQHLKRLTIVEIDGAQFTAAQHFGVSELLEDERVRLVVDDALHFLSTTDEPFDLILVDAWGPDASPSLYSADFHRIAEQHLTERGTVWSKVNPLLEESLAPVKDAVRCTWDNAYYIDRGEGTSALVGTRHAIGGGVERFRLPPADSTCDPLEILYPRRLHTDYSRVAPATAAPGSSRTQ